MDHSDFRPEDYTIDPSAPPLDPVFLLTDWRLIDQAGRPSNPVPGARLRGTIISNHPEHPEGTRITTKVLLGWSGPLATCEDGRYHLDNNPSAIHLSHLGVDSVTAEGPLDAKPAEGADQAP